MSQLSATTGVPVATVKYYLREGLLQPGERLAPNQVAYGEAHLRRLALIRAMITVARLSVAEAKRVVDAIDSDSALAEVFDTAQRTVSEELAPESVERAALGRVDALLAGWHVGADNPGRLAAARTLAALEAAGQRYAPGWLRAYAEAALLAAEVDLDEVDRRADRAAKAETVLVGTVLGDALFAALRRAAQEHVSVRRSAREAPAPI